MNFLIKIITTLIACCLCPSLYSQEANSKFSVKNDLYSLYPTLLSPDAKWVVVNKTYERYLKQDSTFYVNTTNSKKIDITHFSNVHNNLLYNNIIIGKDNQKLVITNLIKNTSTTYADSIQKFDTKALKNKTTLITLSEKKKLEIIELDRNGTESKILFSTNNVSNYYLNTNKDRLVYQINSNKNTLFEFDLVTNNHYKLLDLEHSLSTLYWNYNQNRIAFKSPNNIITVVNLENQSIKYLKLDAKTLERFELKFYTNNDIFIKYNIKTDKKIQSTTYLDIWNGNSKYLSPSEFKQKYELEYKAFVYIQSQDTLQELKRSRDYDYEYIDLPGYILSYNPFDYQDFDNSSAKKKYNLIQLSNYQKTLSTLLRASTNIIPSPDQKHILYKEQYDLNSWKIYNLQNKTEQTLIYDTSLYFSPIWSKDSKSVLYLKKTQLMQLDLEKNVHMELLTINEGTKVEFINIDFDIQSKKRTYNTEKPLLFILNDNQTNNIYKLFKNKTTFIKAIDKNITQASSNFAMLLSEDTNTFIFSQENYDLPSSIKVLTKSRVKTILESTIPEKDYLWRKKSNINYEDKFGKQLQGTLYYPKDFDSKKNYPMIVYTYNLDPTDSKVFQIPSLVNANGFNIPLLTEQNYFVLYAQTYVSQEGPGKAAVDCITKAVDKACKIESTINNEKLGLIGHSFGGYKVSYISTQSNLFSAIVSGAGPHDLIGGYMYRYSSFRNTLDWFMVENGQFGFKDTYKDNPEKYLSSSPILYAHNVKTPMLLWTGLLDENVHWENTRKMYVALKRYNIPTIALFYNGMGHTANNQQVKASIDLTFRIIDWFDYYLKDNKNIEWIKKGTDYNTYSWNQLDDF